MMTLARECDALISAHREIDRLRAGVVELKAHIRAIEAKQIMALGYGTVPQNSTQVLDFIDPTHLRHQHFCHSVIVAPLPSVQDMETVSII